MLAKILSSAVLGIDAYTVEVEAGIGSCERTVRHRMTGHAVTVHIGGDEAEYGRICVWQTIDDTLGCAHSGPAVRAVIEAVAGGERRLTGVAVIHDRNGAGVLQPRFQRRPEGMWLSETAVDLATLEILAENGIRFTILAPNQARQMRRLGEESWIDVSGSRIDPTRTCCPSTVAITPWPATARNSCGS